MYPLCLTFRYLLFYLYVLIGWNFFHIQTFGSFRLCHHLHLGEWYVFLLWSKQQLWSVCGSECESHHLTVLKLKDASQSSERKTCSSWSFPLLPRKKIDTRMTPGVGIKIYSHKNLNSNLSLFRIDSQFKKKKINHSRKNTILNIN